MKIQFKVNEHCTFETEVDNDMKAAFRFLAAADEVFGIRQCGNCESENLRMKHRTAKTQDGRPCDYYSIECRDCGHEFKFGQKQAPGQPLFPKSWEPPYKKGEKSADQSQDYSQDYSQDNEPAYTGNGAKSSW
jgi:hypothetical protein